MKKANKIMMATVAVLLSLVLLSTSILSGVYARFVVKKEVDAIFTMEEFGVTLTISLSPEFEEYIRNTNASMDESDVKIEIKNNNAVIKVENLVMHPGYDFSNAIRFQLGGSATSSVRLKFATDYRILFTDFEVTTGCIEEYFPDLVDDGGYPFIPIGTTFGTKNASGTYDVSYVFEPGESAFNQGDMKSAVKYSLIDKFDLISDGNYSCSKDFIVTSTTPSVSPALHPKDSEGEVDTNTSITEFAFGVKWPGELGENETSGGDRNHKFTRDEFNELEVALVNNGFNDKYLSCYFIVSLEQIV